MMSPTMNLVTPACHATIADMNCASHAQPANRITNEPIAIAATDSAAFVMPSEATVMDHSYPLTRIITMFLDRAPRKPLAPHIREFMRYVLSREAEETVLRVGGGYLPMLTPEARRELKKLED